MSTRILASSIFLLGKNPLKCNLVSKPHFTMNSNSGKSKKKKEKEFTFSGSWNSLHFDIMCIQKLIEWRETCYSNVYVPKVIFTRRKEKKKKNIFIFIHFFLLLKSRLSKHPNIFFSSVEWEWYDHFSFQRIMPLWSGSMMWTIISSFPYKYFSYFFPI